MSKNAGLRWQRPTFQACWGKARGTSGSWQGMPREPAGAGGGALLMCTWCAYWPRGPAESIQSPAKGPGEKPCWEETRQKEPSLCTRGGSPPPSRRHLHSCVTLRAVCRDHSGHIKQRGRVLGDLCRHCLHLSRAKLGNGPGWPWGTIASRSWKGLVRPLSLTPNPCSWVLVFLGGGMV